MRTGRQVGLLSQKCERETVVFQRCRLAVLVMGLCLMCLAGTLGACEDSDRWLSLSYVESPNRAGFGEYRYDELFMPTLYWTHGAVENSRPNGLAVADANAIRLWVRSLLQPDGSFDDPSERAPVLIETQWALRVLALLGDDLADLDSTRRYLGEAILALDYSGHTLSEALTNSLHLAHLLVACCEEFAASGHPVEADCTDSLVASLLELKDLMDGLAQDYVPWSHNLVQSTLWGYFLTLARIAPTAVPEAGRDFLTNHIDALPLAEPGFLACAYLRDLLIALMRVNGWDFVPSEIVDPVQRYLQDEILPLVSSQTGGFAADAIGFAGKQWVDAQKTVPLIRVFALLDLRYPYCQEFNSSLDPLSIPAGWLRQVQLTPDPASTCAALYICQERGLALYDREKVLRYLRDVLEDADSSSPDVLWATRGWQAMVGQVSDLHVVLSERLDSASIQWLEARGDAVVDLMFEFGLSASSPVLETFLTERQSALRESPLVFSIMSALHELWALDTILNDPSLTDAEYELAALSLYSNSGGFFFRSDLDASFGEITGLPPTLQAVRLLMGLRADFLISRERLRTFLASCEAGPGYLTAPRDTLLSLGEELDVSLVYTYCGLQLERYAATGKL